MAESSLPHSIITCQQAKTESLPRYFTGEPCKLGHLAERYTLNRNCVACAVKASKYHYDANTAAIKIRHKAWFKDNREAARALSRNWYRANPEKAKAMRRRTTIANREQLRIKGLARYAANPEPFKVRAANRRSRLLQADGFHVNTDIDSIYSLQGKRCANLGCRVSIRKILGSKKSSYHIDHVMPLALGGSNWPHNIQLLCPKCNRSKNAFHPLEFARRSGVLF